MSVRLLSTRRRAAEFSPKSAYMFGIFSFYGVQEVIVQPLDKSDLGEDFHPQNMYIPGL